MISQTIEYALRAMNHLARLEPGKSANSEVIAQQTQMPKGYLSKILRDLVLAELILSQRGPNGGFCLAKPPSEISILDVANAVDQIQRIRRCPLGNPMHTELCPLHQRIDDALAMVEQEFAKTRLSEVVESNENAKRQCKRLTLPQMHARPE